MKLNEVIKKLREKLNTSQTVLGKLLGVSQGMIGHWENKRRHIHYKRFKKLKKLCEKHGIIITFEELQ